MVSKRTGLNLVSGHVKGGGEGAGFFQNSRSFDRSTYCIFVYVQATGSGYDLGEFYHRHVV